MAVTETKTEANLTVKGITPGLKILGAYQKLTFGAEESPEPLGSFRLDNIFVPTPSMSSQTNSETRNNTLSGYRWIQTTAFGDTYGDYKLQRFLNASPTGEDILLISAAGDLTFGGNLDMGGNRVINAGDPVDDQDLVTKAFLAEYVEDITGVGDIVLSGAITGAGSLTVPVETALSTGVVLQDPIQHFYYNYGATPAQFLIANLSDPDDGAINTSLGLSNVSTAGYRIRHVTTSLLNDYTKTGTAYFEAIGPTGTIQPFFNLGYLSGSFPYITFSVNLITDKTIVVKDNGAIVMQTGSAITVQDGAFTTFQTGSITTFNGVISVPTPMTGLHATNKTYVDGKTWTSSSITDFASAVNTIVDTSFGPNVALPFVGLNYNWANPANVSDPGTEVPYILKNSLTDNAPFYKALIWRVQAGGSYWDVDYDLGDPGSLAGPSVSFRFFHAISNVTVTPFTITYTSPTAGTINSQCILDMGGKKVVNAATPTANNDLTTKLYVDNHDWLSTDITDFASAVNNLVDTTFGPDITLPSKVLNFIWPNGTEVFDQYFFTHKSVTSSFGPIPLNFQYLIDSGTSGTRSWTTSYTISNYPGSYFSSCGFQVDDPRTGSLNPLTMVYKSAVSNVCIGIGTLTPNSSLQIYNHLSNRIFTLYETVNNDHQFIGFGINTNVFRYQVSATTVDNVWYAGTSSATSNELMRLSGAGDLTVAGALFASVPTEVMYFQNNATGTTITANVFAKLSGTTFVVNSSPYFSMPSNGRLTVLKNMPNSRIEAVLTMKHGISGGSTVSLAIYKNGAVLVPSLVQDFEASLNVPFPVILVAPSVNILNGDYFEVYGTFGNNGTLTAINLALTIRPN